jgi:hypothetical protein
MGAAVAPRARRYFWRAETGPAWTRWPSKMKVTKEQMIATMASLNFLKVPANKNGHPLGKPTPLVG